MNNEPLNALSEEKPNYKKFNRQGDNSFYAAYLNTAKQNIFLILRDISDKLGLEFDKTDDDNMLKKNSAIWTMLEENQKPELSKKIIDRLEHQFSFAKQLALNHAREKAEREDEVEENDRKVVVAGPEDYYEVLQLWISQLLDYRNYYSHAKHKPIEMDVAIIDGMRVLFDTDWKPFKERFGFSDSDVKHLERRGEKGREKRNFKYAFMDKHGLTEKGFLYFVCLWLEKKDAQEFLKKHEGFKRSELIYEKATLERYTWFRTRIPQPRLVSDRSEQGLFMDMINELKRCPKPLHDLLSEADKDKFKPQEFNGEAYEEEGYELIPTLTRHSNRFYHFALCFLDQSTNHLKFHVDLGNYCFHSYDQIIDDEPRKRRWIKRMTGFGNLADFDDTNRPAAWGEKFPDPTEVEKPETYITETTPHYHFDGEGDVKNIGLKWIETYDKNKIWPDVTVADEDEGNARPKTEAPDFWLSLYELPALVFYQMLHLQDNTRVKVSVEQVIHDYKKRIGQFLSEVANGSITPDHTAEMLAAELEKRNLHTSYVPKAVVKYLLKKESKSHDEKAVIRLNELIAETERLQSKVKRQAQHYQKKTSSKDYVAMKSGEMADFLARDMIRLQKPVEQDQGKANSTEFQVLQAKLAYFGQSKGTLKSTFALCNLIDAPNAHPFLNKIAVEKYHGILDFYIEYLHQRISYFKLCLLDKKYNTYHFLKLGEVDKSIQTLISRQQAAVMNLPRGLFKKPILDALLSSNESRELGKRLKAEPRANVAYIIQSYFEEVRKDASQDFYGYKRNYPLLDKLYDTKRPSDRNKKEQFYLKGEELDQKKEEIKQKLEEKIAKHIKVNKVHNATDQDRVRDNYHKAYKAFTDNEKQIRLYKNCDMVLFMMTDHMYRHGDFLYDRVKKEKQAPLIQMEGNYQLRSIQPNAEKSLLSLQMDSVSLHVYYPEKTKEHCKTIVKEGLKVKNYGDFRGFLKDRRLYSLLPYLAAEEIQFAALQKEFEEFHKSRVEVFEAILSFERAVMMKYHPQAEDGYDFVNHKIILGAVPTLTEESKETMVALRNAYCHSEYPDVEKFRHLVEGSDFNALGSYAKEHPEVMEKSIIGQLKKIAIKSYNEAREAIL